MAKKKFLFDWTPIVALFDTCTAETAAPRNVVLTFSATPGKNMRGMTTANFKVALTAAPFTIKVIDLVTYNEAGPTITIRTSVAHAFANGQPAHTLTFYTGKTANTIAITNNVA